jgi:hypothetical protein
MIQLLNSEIATEIMIEMELAIIMRISVVVKPILMLTNLLKRATDAMVLGLLPTKRKS